jgi:uncharacterized protein (DUF1778 family)
VLALAKPDTHNDNPQQRLQALNQMSPTFRGFTMLMRIQSALGTVLAASFLSLSSADQKLLINTLDPSPGPDTTTDLMQAALLMSDWYSEAKRQRARAAAQAVRLAARRNHTGLGPHAVAQGATTPQPSTTSGS